MSGQPPGSKMWRRPSSVRWGVLSLKPAPGMVSLLFQAMDEKRGAFGIKKTDPISKVEDRFLTGANYPVRVLGIAGTNTQ